MAIGAFEGLAGLAAANKETPVPSIYMQIEGPFGQTHTQTVRPELQDFVSRYAFPGDAALGTNPERREGMQYYEAGITSPEWQKLQAADPATLSPAMRFFRENPAHFGQYISRWGPGDSQWGQIFQYSPEAFAAALGAPGVDPALGRAFLEEQSAGAQSSREPGFMGKYGQDLMGFAILAGGLGGVLGGAAGAAGGGFSTAGIGTAEAATLAAEGLTAAEIGTLGSGAVTTGITAPAAGGLASLATGADAGLAMGGGVGGGGSVLPAVGGGELSAIGPAQGSFVGGGIPVTDFGAGIDTLGAAGAGMSSIGPAQGTILPPGVDPTGTATSYPVTDPGAGITPLSGVPVSDRSVPFQGFREVSLGDTLSNLGAIAQGALSPGGLSSALGFQLGGTGQLASLANAASSLYGLYESRKQKKLAAELAARADPFGQYRPGYGQSLAALEANPNSITSTPGYQFELEQGLEALKRKLAASGFLGSGNEAIAIQKYGQDYAATRLNEERNRLATLAGAGFNPAAAGQLQLAGETSANATREAALRALGYTLFGR